MDIPNFGDMGNLDVLKNHIQFPVTKQQIVDTINKIPEIPDSIKTIIETKLPDGTYGSIEDIKKAIGI